MRGDAAAADIGMRAAIVLIGKDDADFGGNLLVLGFVGGDQPGKVVVVGGSTLPC